MPALMDFQIPKITHEDVTPTHGAFVIEPLDRGFGHTYGNSLRRVLLSTIEGTAVTSVKIEGVAHEFSSIKGVREDVTDIILNLKGLVARLHGEISDIEARILKEGPGVVTAADIDASSELEILNPELEICHLAEGARLEMMLTIGRGRGYVAADGNKGPETTIGMIPVDSIFSPVRRVSVHVDSARVGQRTDYDKLTLDIYTDGSVTRARRSSRPPRCGAASWRSSRTSTRAIARAWPRPRPSARSSPRCPRPTGWRTS
jgi:DNA-directed RNA polymerase subunit alpha